MLVGAEKAGQLDFAGAVNIRTCQYSKVSIVGNCLNLLILLVTSSYYCPFLLSLPQEVTTHDVLM